MMRPEPGDVILTPGGVRYVIDGSHFGIDFGDGRGPKVLAVTNLHGGRAYRDEDKVSASGGPCPLIPLSELTHIGETEQKFWRFKNGIRRAGNSEEYIMMVQCFRWGRGSHWLAAQRNETWLGYREFREEEEDG